MKTRHFCFSLLWVLLMGTAFSPPCDGANKRIEDGIEDYLLSRLAQQKILVLPECLSHDSYDAVQLPIRLMRKWLEDDHKIKKLIVGLEMETDSKEFELIRSNRYHLFERSATICPSAWGLFSTRNLNMYLFLREVINEAPDRFKVFGYENSYHYYDPKTNTYPLPSQIDTLAKVEKIDYFNSSAPMVIRYAYSRFYRDYRSFATIKDVIEANPDARLLILVGNAHTLKEISFNDTDRQIIEAYHIDTSRHTHPLGYFLKQRYPTSFVQSTVDKSTAITRNTLVEYDGDSSEIPWFKNFFTDYYYVIPAGENVNLEEPPLLCIPSAQNLSLLQDKRFQIYSSEEYYAVAKRLVYLLTGITPEVKEDAPGQTGPCTFIDPHTQKPIDFRKFDGSLIRWYGDGAFIERLREDVAGYNHRSLFEGIFRMMGKKDFKTLTDTEAKEFSNYLLSVLTVVGTEREQAVARKCLSKVWGKSKDHYFYYKKYYYKHYRA